MKLLRRRIDTDIFGDACVKQQSAAGQMMLLKCKDWLCTGSQRQTLPLLRGLPAAGKRGLAGATPHVGDFLQCLHVHFVPRKHSQAEELDYGEFLRLVLKSLQASTSRHDRSLARHLKRETP